MFDFIKKALFESFDNHINDFEEDIIKIYTETSSLKLPKNCFNDDYIKNKQDIIDELTVGLDVNFLKAVQKDLEEQLSEESIFKLVELLKDNALSAGTKEKLKKLSINEGIKVAEDFYNKYDYATRSNEGYVIDLIFEVQSEWGHSTNTSSIV